MIEVDLFDIIMAGGGLLLSTLLTAGGVLWKLLGDLKKANIERRELWDAEILVIHEKFNELMRDHADIKENGIETKRMVNQFKDVVESRIERILVEHGSHEKDQAVQLEILRDIKEQLRRHE